MQRSSRGIAMVVLAVVIVAIIAVAAAAAYFALSSGSPYSTAAASTTATTTATMQSTTSLTSTSTPPMASSNTTISSTTTSSSTIPTMTTTTSPPTSSSTLSSFTCTSTSATASTSALVDYTTQYIGLIKEFSSIEFKVNGTSGGKAENETFGYTTTPLSSGIYNVSVSSSAVTTGSFTFVVDTNNDTVLSANLFGQSSTGSEAKQEFDSFMGLFGLEEYYTGEIGVFTDPTYFANQGTTTQTYGTVSFTVTTYGLNSPNEVVDYCGVSATISSYTLSVGTPPGTSLLFITLLQFAGTANGTSTDITFQLVSMTLQS